MKNLAGGEWNSHNPSERRSGGGMFTSVILMETCCNFTSLDQSTETVSRISDSSSVWSYTLQSVGVLFI